MEDPPRKRVFRVFLKDVTRSFQASTFPLTLEGLGCSRGWHLSSFKNWFPVFFETLCYRFSKRNPEKVRCGTSLLPNWWFASLDGSHHHRSFNRKRPLEAMPSLWVGIWKSTRNVFATAFLPGVARLGRFFFGLEKHKGWRVEGLREQVLEG